MKLFLLGIYCLTLQTQAFPQDSINTHSLKQRYLDIKKPRTFRLKDIINNCNNSYYYAKGSKKPYRITSYKISGDTAYDFVFIDSLQEFCTLLIRETPSQKKRNFFQYWIYNEKMYPLSKTKKKLSSPGDHSFILREMEDLYSIAVSFLLNHK